MSDMLIDLKKPDSVLVDVMTHDKARQLVKEGKLVEKSLDYNNYNMIPNGNPVWAYVDERSKDLGTSVVSIDQNELTLACFKPVKLEIGFYQRIIGENAGIFAGSASFSSQNFIENSKYDPTMAA